MISAEQKARIRRLFYAEHWKAGTIAAELGVHRDTVLGAIEAQRMLRPDAVVRPSMLDPHKAFIEQVLAEHPRLRSTRLFQMLRERGFAGSPVQLRRYVRAVRPVPRQEAFLRLHVLPGELAQVDWAHFGRIAVGRAQRALSCFVMVLAWSRAMWARFCLDQTQESFLRGHVGAFAFFRGVPRAIAYDNLKSVVLERVGDHIRFHPRILEVAGHYHFEPRPCAPYRGNEKGRVERTIRYVRDSFFPARHFTSVDDLNAQLERWIAQVAHERKVPGGQSDLRVREALEEERPRLLALPEHAFGCDLVRPVCSGKDPYVRFDLNDYSVPHTLVKKPLTLVASDTRVRILDGAALVADHERSWDRARTVECEEHIAALARQKRHAAELRGRDRLRQACPAADGFIAALCARQMHLASNTARLLKLLDRHGAAELDAAIAAALARGAVSAHSVAHILDARRRLRDAPPVLDAVLPDDPRVRDLRLTPHRLEDYDALGRTPEDKEKP